jgi:hypothetical protein
MDLSASSLEIENFDSVDLFPSSVDFGVPIADHEDSLDEILASARENETLHFPFEKMMKSLKCSGWNKWPVTKSVRLYFSHSFVYSSSYVQYLRVSSHN